MQIDYQITEDDFVSAGRLALKKRSKGARLTLYFLPVFGVVLIGSSVIVSIAEHRLTGSWPAALWGSFLVCIPLLWNYQFRKIFRRTTLLQERRTLTIDDSTLHFQSASSDGRVVWQTYIGFAEDEQVFILFQQGNQIFIPIPKRELAPFQVDQLRSLFETHLPRK